MVGRVELVFLVFICSLCYWDNLVFSFRVNFFVFFFLIFGVWYNCLILFVIIVCIKFFKFNVLIRAIVNWVLMLVIFINWLNKFFFVRWLKLKRVIWFWCIKRWVKICWGFGGGGVYCWVKEWGICNL